MKYRPLKESDIDLIAKTYLESVERPERKLPRQMLLAPIGLVGVGKTTVAKMLIEEMPEFAYTSTHDYRLIMRDMGINFWDCGERRRQIVEVYLRVLLEEGHSVYEDFDVVEKWMRDLLDMECGKVGAETFYFHIVADAEDPCTTTWREISSP